MIELKSCPTCNSIPKLLDDGFGYAIKCKCGSILPKYDEDSMAFLWNRHVEKYIEVNNDRT